MMKDLTLYSKINMPDRNFPIQVRFVNSSNTGNTSFSNHWHEEIEFLFVISGQAVIECNSTPYETGPGDLIVLNSNDLHYGHNFSNDLKYYCLIVDPCLLRSNSIDICETKYITPITQNLILFNNKVSNSKTIQQYIQNIVTEYHLKNTGYELAIKSTVYQLLVFLLRNHVSRILTVEEYNSKTKNLQRFRKVFQYIEEHYTEEISTHNLSKMVNISHYYFSHLFKELTGKSLSRYVNQLRINRAEQLLKSTDMNVTEVALETGFNEIPYFSRLFKRYKNIAPSKVRKEK